MNAFLYGSHITGGGGCYHPVTNQTSTYVVTLNFSPRPKTSNSVSDGVYVETLCIRTLQILCCWNLRGKDKCMLMNGLVSDGLVLVTELDFWGL